MKKFAAVLFFVLACDGNGRTEYRSAFLPMRIVSVEKDDRERCKIFTEALSFGISPRYSIITLNDKECDYAPDEEIGVVISRQPRKVQKDIK